MVLDNSSSFNYFFFNLVVSLPFEVDFLNPVNERADITFTFDENIKFPKNYPKKEIWSLSNINKAFFYNKNIGLFEITNGKSVRLSLKKEISKEEIIKNFGSDAVRLFILSDSPPEKDVQWSEQGMASSYKFIQKLWILHNEINEKIKEGNKIKINEKIEKFVNQKKSIQAL